MYTFAVHLTRLPQDLRAGMKSIMSERPDRFGGPAAIPLRFEPGTPSVAGCQVTCGQEVVVRYGRTIDAFRALGRLLGVQRRLENFAEQPAFDLTGAMFDVSRNGVLNVATVCALLRRMALMGLNMFILYTEDTYAVPDEPFFGYLRGAYSQRELRQMDAYAAQFGIEMFPCIQALAHMAQVLQWPAYAAVADTEQVLLAQHEPTYELIEKLIQTASAPFRSRRIHLGMDEAAGIGTGQFSKKFGPQPPFDILIQHLARVRDLCARHGLKPMIWSDMFFRLGSSRHDYYDRELVIPPAVVQQIPAEVQLVYWDYYHMDQSFYEEWIDRHRALGSEPIMAGGVWTWNRFWTQLPLSFRMGEACLRACRAKGLREVFMTMWADGGCEVDFYSALPGLQHFAEYAYSAVVEPAQLRANFRGSCAADFDAWVRASDLDAIPALRKPDESIANPAKFLLWQDPLLALMDPYFDGIDLSRHYARLAADLYAASRRGRENRRLRFPAQLAKVLSAKAHLRRNLAQAYRRKDRRRLRRLADDLLPALISDLRRLWHIHRDLWAANQKPFGWESLERRYGGMIARLQTVRRRLQQYLAGTVKEIPELDAELHRPFPVADGELPNVAASRVATPSFLKY